MLFLAVFSVNAQSIMGDSVKYLPKGVGKGAYHLQLTRVGDTYIGGGSIVLAADSAGYVYLENANWYRSAPAGLAYKESFKHLREGLWCVEVVQEKAGMVPAYVFTNKEHGFDLAMWGDKNSFKGSRYGTFPSYITSADSVVPSRPWAIQAQKRGSVATGNRSDWPLVGGKYQNWAFSVVYNTSTLETSQFLKIELDDDPDYFMTFAMDSLYTPGTVPTLSTGSPVWQHHIRLIRVHANDFNPGSGIYPYLCRFTLRNAGPRVLNAEDFNTKIGEQSLDATKAEGGIQLEFDPNATEGNVFYDNKLWASDASVTKTGANAWTGRYIRLQSYSSKEYITVLDGDKDENYYNALGNKYPKFALTDKKENDGRNEFRFVYYPSEDSLIINVLTIDNPTYGFGSAISDLTTTPYDPIYDNLFNYEINNHLIVRMQDLDTKDTRVITVYNHPAQMRAHFGVKECNNDKERATVEEGLYTIKDRNGNFLVIDLGNGDYTPTWKKLEASIDNNYNVDEIAKKIPSYQWMVVKVDSLSGVSRIHLINRELEHIRIEYVQIYDEYRIFTGQVNWEENYNPGASYVAIGKNYVNKDCFIPVVDDPAAAALKASYGDEWMEKMPQDMLQKLYRTNPFIGYKYIAPDTLNYYGYAFNYLTYMGEKYYIGVKNDLADNDSTMRVNDEATYFELLLPDTLMSLIKGGSGRPTEKYGLGFGTADGLLNRLSPDKTYKFDDPKSEHYIAKLERSYYYVKVNDYWKFNMKRHDQYIVIDDNKHYAFTPEQNANSRSLQKTKFYFRYSYDKKGREYYALLDRIDKSNFQYLVDKFGFEITDSLKSYDISHGAITTKAFGVLLAQVDDANTYVTAKPKNQDRHISGFALEQINEPLYRRFNVAKDDDGKDNDDTPRLLKFYDVSNPAQFLYEDAHSSTALPYNEYPKINYLGFENEAECQKAQDRGDGHWHASHNYIIYVDTAYVNRGTGWIKPQYLLVMNPKIALPDTGINNCGEEVTAEYSVYGRYLINATDSAREKGFITATHAMVRDDRYIWQEWERLAFVDAIHMGDSLYILRGHDISEFDAQCNKDGQPLNILSKAKLIKAHKAGAIDIHRLDDNFHKDVVFSMRFVERQIKKDGTPSGASKNFYIESETTNRSITQGRMIAPMNGGWVKIQNNVPVISRGSYDDPIVAPFTFDVFKAGTDDPEAATSNDEVVEVRVIGGKDQVTIQNAANKRVMISNILGQTVTNTVLDSDNVTVSAPQGVIVVTVEGEKAVKAVVK